MQSKNALSNLKNRYVAVLKKCALINIFGSLTAATLLLSPTSAFANALITTNEPELNNNGTLTGEQETISGRNYFVGMFGHNKTGNVNYLFTNFEDGIINVSSDLRAAGMLIYADGNHKLINNGTITATSIGEDAYGMGVIGNGNHKLINNGNITATSTSDYAYGMYAYGRGDHILTNNGTITATVADDYVYGMYAYGVGNHIFTNNDAITATSTNDYAYGMYAYGNGDHKLTNNSTINATSKTERAYGMHSSSDGNHILTNNGTINATSETDRAYGMYASGVGNHIFTNSGIINAVSTNDNSYGVFVSGNNNNGVHLVNNTGIINTNAPMGNAFEVNGTTPYTIGTFATTLREWEVDDTVFATNSTTYKITFANSTLILRPGTKAQGFEYGKPYNVTDMIVYDSSNGFGVYEHPTAITGNIQNVTAEVPFLTATLDNSDPTKPKVSLSTNVSAETVSPTQLTKLQSANTQNKITRMVNRKINKMIERRMAKNLRQVSEKAYEQGVILAGDMITSAPSYQENKWAIYLDAYAGYIGNSEYNLGTHTKGMTLGGEKAISDKLNVGFAMDFSDSTTDGQDGLVADSTDITLAANADYFINDNWYVSGNMALSFGENDMDYALSSSLTAEDDYNSQAFYMAVNTGYVYEINKNNIIVPEFGLSYLYTQTDDLDIDFVGSDLYDMHINNDSFSALYANLMVTWQGHYELARGILSPTAGIGLRQNLTGSDFDSSISMLGSSFDTVASEDDTTFLTNVGLEWKNNAFSMGISYNGEYGSNQKSHSGNVKFRLEF